MAPKHILLLGGHGKVSLLLTPHLLARSHNLTSVIRNPDQKAAILERGAKGPGKVDVLVESLEDVKSEADAKRILDKVKPDWVIWSAGAGGKGGASRTYAIDQHACIAFIRAATSTPSIRKFLLVSAQNERRNKAPWWDDGAWEETQKVNSEVLRDYYKAKLASDEALTVLGEERRKKKGDDGFSYVILRPGMLEDGEPKGKVQVGRTSGRGAVRRADVADVAARLLETEANGWYDLINGDVEVGKAVQEAVAGGKTAVEGEDIEVMRRNMEG